MYGISKIKAEAATATLIIVALIVGVGAGFILKPDNVIEETSEYVVEKHLDLPEGSLDFSPGTPED